MSDSCALPVFDSAEAAALADRLFGLDGPLRRLDGERDLNFLIGEAGARHVFKIANAGESRAFLECQHQVLDRVARQRPFPLTATARSSLAGRQIESVRAADGRSHFCRVLPFLEGRMLAEIEAPGDRLLEDLGGGLARLDRALDGYRHPALQRPLLWSMERGLEVIEASLPALGDHRQQQLVERCLRRFRRDHAARLGGLRRALIHNDANRGNVLVDHDGERLLGLIDFGDMEESWLIVEAAIAATYAMLDRQNPLPMAAAVLRGYHRDHPLSAAEIAVTPGLIRLRACMSLCINARQSALEPDNDYLNVDSAASLKLLEYLDDVDDSETAAAISPL